MIGLLLAVGAAVWLVGAMFLLWLYVEHQMVRDTPAGAVVMIVSLILWPAAFPIAWGGELAAISLKRWRRPRR